MLHFHRVFGLPCRRRELGHCVVQVGLGARRRIRAVMRSMAPFNLAHRNLAWATLAWRFSMTNFPHLDLVIGVGTAEQKYHDGLGVAAWS